MKDTNGTNLCMQCFHAEPHDADEGACTWTAEGIYCGCFCPERGVLIQEDALADLRAQLAAARERVEELEKDVKELDDECNDQHSSLTHINWKISLLESRLAQRDAEIARLLKDRKHK